MSDRELLELAAKAAGLPVRWGHASHQMLWTDRTVGSEYQEPAYWNPITDDGDAFRLAVKLKIDVAHTNIHSPQVHALTDSWIQQWEDIGDDPYSATRRAIVRAAAEIGRQMK